MDQKDVLDPDWRKRLVDSISHGPLAAARDITATHLVRTGTTRVAEATLLDWVDIVFNADDVSVDLKRCQTKTCSGYTVVLDRTSPHTEAAMLALRTWAERLTRILGRPPLASEPVFPAHVNSSAPLTRLSVAQMGRRLRRTSQTILGQPLSGRSARRQRITDLAAQGKSRAEIARLLGLRPER